MDDIEKNLKTNIKKVFFNMSYYNSYSNDIWLTIIIITIVLTITIRFFFVNNLESNKGNWDKLRCNPLFMPFGKNINSSTNENFNIDNFNSCLNDSLFGFSLDLKDPISAIFSFFGGILAIGSVILTTIMSFFVYLFNIVLNFYKQMVLLLTKIAQASNELFESVNNFLGNILGFLSIIYYDILIVVDSIKLIFPIMALAFVIAVVIPATIFVVALIVSLTFFCMIVGLPFGFGLWAIPLVALYVIIVGIGIAFLIFIYFIAHVLAEACEQIANKILAPLSSTHEINMSMPLQEGNKRYNRNNNN